MKRQEALENARRMEKLQKLKEDQRIRREIIQATRESQCGGIYRPASVTKQAAKTVKQRSTVFFLSVAAQNGSFIYLQSNTLKQSAESFFLTEGPVTSDDEQLRGRVSCVRKGSLALERVPFPS